MIQRNSGTNEIIEIYQSGKGYKAISKALGLQRTTVRAIIHKWRKHGTVVKLPRSVRPTKITPRVRRLIQEVTKTPQHPKNCRPHLPQPGRLAVVNGTMNSAVYQKFLKENVWPSVHDLKLKRTWVLQQDNDPKHHLSTSEWLKKNKIFDLA
ncbi:hypothetical protein P4O66_013699 [Electrophorus voltai]|uniref:Sleeping Beauty transposase HTH domain-containing protein n=1 Tax=Electrophorus voltai TaxID=2609070 RepID=A0AAD8Z585_9TELE|nr:hypothetical protein P4O66_013699 [Electrophorus voltai]